MSSNANGTGNGSKSSRIDISQIGDDNWNKSFTAKAAAPGAPARRGANTAGQTGQPASPDALLAGRVQATAARRAVNRNRGQGRIWLLAGALLLASLGGIAAAYYLVGAPMAVSAYGPGVAGTGKLEATSLLLENNAEDRTGAHLQTVTIAATVPASAPAEPGGPAHTSLEKPLDLPAPPPGIEPRGETVLQEPVAPEFPEQQEATETLADADRKSETDQAIEAAMEPAPEASSASDTANPENERLVQIVPAAQAGEAASRTNVNVSGTPPVPRKTIGQWLAVPAETGLAAPPEETAAAAQQSTRAMPASGTVKTQEELFEFVSGLS